MSFSQEAEAGRVFVHGPLSSRLHFPVCRPLLPSGGDQLPHELVLTPQTFELQPKGWENYGYALQVHPEFSRPSLRFW